MNKYMLMALLPIIFQNTIYCDNSHAEFHQEMMPYLIRARQAMRNVNVALELDPILNALNSYAAVGATEKNQAIAQLRSIKKSLENYEAKQYPTTFSRWFGSTPQIVTEKIRPALQQVNNSLKKLNASSNNYGYAIAGTAGGVALAGAAALYLSQQNNTPTQKTPSQKDKFRETADYFSSDPIINQRNASNVLNQEYQAFKGK